MGLDKEELWDRLTAFPGHIQRWLAVDRQEVMEGVIRGVLGEFAAAESPDQREGVSTGLDFLRLLKQEGGDNVLWQVGMDQLDSEIYSAVAALSDDEQVALLLPWVDDLDGMATERDGEEWADILRQQCDHEWQPVLRRLLMEKID